MRIIRISEVREMTSLARSTIYKYIHQGEFPKPISLGGRAVGWIESEVVEWITDRIAERDGALHAELGKGEI